MEPMEILKKILGLEEKDYSGWEQAGKLKPDDVAARRVLDARSAEITDEIELLLKKVYAAKAQGDVLFAEWWQRLHKAYGLPRNREYHLTDDGTILMSPEKK